MLTVSLLEKIGLSTFSSSQSEGKKADLSVYPNQKERQKNGFICLSVWLIMVYRFIWFMIDIHCQTANKQCYKEHFDQNIRSCPLGECYEYVREGVNPVIRTVFIFCKGKVFSNIGSGHVGIRKNTR